LVEKSGARPQLRGRYLGENSRHLHTIKLVEKSGARPQLRGRYLGANSRHLHTFQKRGEIGARTKGYDWVDGVGIRNCSG